MKDSPHNTLQSSSNYDNPGFMYDSGTKGSGHGDEISQDTTESETAQFAYWNQNLNEKLRKHFWRSFLSHDVHIKLEVFLMFY